MKWLASNGPVCMGRRTREGSEGDDRGGLAVTISPEAEAIGVGVVKVEEGREFIDSNCMGIWRIFSKDLGDVVEGVVRTKNVMSIVLSVSWEEGSLSVGEGKELVVQGSGVGRKPREELKYGVGR